METNDSQELDGFKECYLTIDEIKIHYQIGGNGPAIMLIHGWPFTWLEWKKVMPVLASLGYTVITPDLVGCGKSDIPLKKYTKYDIAKILAQLIDTINLENVTVLGTDIGMMVAYSLAANFPQKIEKVILGEGALPGFGLEDLMNPAQGGSWHFGFQMQSEFAATVIGGNEKEYYSSFWKIMSPDNGSNEEFISKFLQYYNNVEYSRGGFNHYASLLEDAEFNAKNPKRNLDMPVLVLNGDKGIPQFITVNSVKQIAKNYTTAIVENCGHSLAEDNPKETVKHILNFIKN